MDYSTRMLRFLILHTHYEQHHPLANYDELHPIALGELCKPAGLPEKLPKPQYPEQLRCVSKWGGVVPVWGSYQLHAFVGTAAECRAYVASQPDKERFTFDSDCHHGERPTEEEAYSAWLNQWGVTPPQGESL